MKRGTNVSVKPIASSNKSGNLTGGGVAVSNKGVSGGIYHSRTGQTTIFGSASKQIGKDSSVTVSANASSNGYCATNIRFEKKF